MVEKIIGYILLFVGIVVIVLSAFNMYQVFTHTAKPVQFFSKDNATLDLNSLINSMTPNTGNSALKNLPAANIVNESAMNEGLNLTLHIVLLGFISGAGYKLASLGVMLLRSIQVKLLENPIPVTKKIIAADVK